jgi:Sec-independent protein secretion pathway component TatC
MKSLTVTALSLIVAALLSIGGLVFALFLFFPLFLLGLTGVLSGLEDRTE